MNRPNDTHRRTSDTLAVMTMPLTNWAPHVLDANCEYFSFTLGSTGGYAGLRNIVEAIRQRYPGAFSMPDTVIGYARGWMGRLYDSLGVGRYPDPAGGPPSVFPPALQYRAFVRDTALAVVPEHWLNLTPWATLKTGDPGFLFLVDPLAYTTCPWNGQDLGARMVDAANRPYLRWERYWRLVKETVILPGQTNTWSETVTRGVSQSFGKTWERSFSREAGASGGAFGIGASVSVTLNNTYGGSFTFEISEENTITTTVSQAGQDGVIMSYAQWQLMDVFRVVNASGGPWTHPNWVVDPVSMGPWVVAGSLTVPDIVRFALD